MLNVYFPDYHYIHASQICTCLKTLAGEQIAEPYRLTAKSLYSPPYSFTCYLECSSEETG